MQKRRCIVNISFPATQMEQVNQVAPPKHQHRSRYVSAAVRNALRDWLAAKRYLEEHEDEAITAASDYRAYKYRAVEEDISRVPADPTTRAIWVLCREASAGNVEAQRMAESLWW